MPTSIADLWVPDVWVPALREKANSQPSLVNSGAVVKSPEFDAIASGPGTAAKIPFIKDLTDQDDEIQKEDHAPTNQKAGSGIQNAPILNRVTSNDATALAAAVSGVDVVSEILVQLGLRRLKQRQKTLLSILRGNFVAALAANSGDYFSEDASTVLAGASAGNYLADADKIIDIVARLGELGDATANGFMFVHPQIRAALLKQDENDFERTSENGRLILERYKGVPLYTSNLLRRAGTTSGYVYDSYIVAGGVIAYGEKPQLGDVIDVASLQYEADKGKNNQTIYDRTRFLMHLEGTKWKGTPAGESATNEELATAANWELAVSSSDRVGAVRLRTNG